MLLESLFYCVRLLLRQVCYKKTSSRTHLGLLCTISPIAFSALFLLDVHSMHFGYDRVSTKAIQLLTPSLVIDSNLPNRINQLALMSSMKSKKGPCVSKQCIFQGLLVQKPQLEHAPEDPVPVIFNGGMHDESLKFRNWNDIGKLRPSVSIWLKHTSPAFGHIPSPLPSNLLHSNTKHTRAHKGLARAYYRKNHRKSAIEHDKLLKDASGESSNTKMFHEMMSNWVLKPNVLIYIGKL
ncbi:hypothetical protein VNO77_22699 [Canavalia gladiata]|uniref:Uncharacterized protein n=1 Tax=Canavalia gladiata TaxID=3824 RepID=A0AAN9L388_CANGL